MATKYTIELEYETGDTNGRHDATCQIGEWTNLEYAKASLKRIHEHYDWYKCRREGGFCWRHHGKKCPSEPDWHKKMALPKHSHESDRQMYVEIFKDDGSPEVIGTYTWCGYFESLYGGKIVIVDGTDDMSFTVG